MKYANTLTLDVRSGINGLLFIKNKKKDRPDNNTDGTYQYLIQKV